MSNPQINPAILISPVDQGYVAYDPVRDQLHELNPLAALLAELCDGSRSAEEIRQIASPLLPDGQGIHIDQWLRDAEAVGLLNAGGVGAKPREFSSNELARLASRLRDNGKIQTAFICQRRAAEMVPTDAGKWSFLGELAHILGRRDDARAAYQKYIALRPDDAEVKLLLVALQDGPAPPRVPDECIQQLYKRFSSFYESNVCNELDYRGPQRIQELVFSQLGDRTNLSVLDLGCGSGLAGVRFKPKAARLVGVDLSLEMVDLARGRKIYDSLEVAEITAWLGRQTERFDLAVACDTLIYFGDLKDVIAGAARLLQPGGLLAFTLECGGRYPFHLSDSGRYTHHPQHVRERAADAGLRVLHLDEAFLRMEYGEEVTGIFTILKNEA